VTSERILDQWEEFLSPEAVRAKLVTAGLFIVTYEMLEKSIVGRLSSFYTFGFNEKGDLRSPEYEDGVLALDPKGKRDVLRSSLVWLEQRGVMSSDDVALFIKVKDARNEIAHELDSIIGGVKELKIDDQLVSAIGLLRQIEVWWTINVEIATDPDWSDKEIDEKDVTPGTLLLMQILLDVALGDDDEASKHLKAFRAFRETRKT